MLFAVPYIQVYQQDQPMAKVTRGTNRLVFAIGNVAIKIPSLHNGPRYFVQGMLSNMLEDEYWRLHRHRQLAPVYHCGPLGLWQVMKRYRNIINRRLTTEERSTLPFINIDDNGANIAIDNGELVMIDYGNVDWYYVAPEMPD